jgi:hypothetical protein
MQQTDWELSAVKFTEYMNTLTPKKGQQFLVRLSIKSISPHFHTVASLFLLSLEEIISEE